MNPFGWSYPPGVTANDIERAAGNVETIDSAAFGRFFEVVAAEVDDARAKFGEFASAHEGYAVLLEEMDELKVLVWSPIRSSSLYARMRKEAIQIAAMAFCFVDEVCEPNIRMEGNNDKE